MKRRALLLLVAVVVAADLLALNMFAFAPSGRTVQPSVAAEPGAPVTLSPASIAPVEATLERLYHKVSPSVVAIRVVQKQTFQFPAIPEIPGFPFFNVPPGRQSQYVQAEGSGFVWNTAGDIVTNNHVVTGADRIAVTFADGSTVPGRVVGTDPSSDLAVVRVNTPPSTLHPAQLADSTQVKVGQLAVAIGNPFGEQNTMTLGIVSAVGRALPATDGNGPTYTIPDVIQTDAPINPGNSGGVLLDLQGQVIGVTSAIESPVRASAGIGFAIPAAIVQRVVPALITTGHATHAWVGLSGITLTPDLAKAMGLSETQRGALIADVAPGGPAQKAGLRGSTRAVTLDGQQLRVGGDVIVAIDGRPVKGFGDLVTYLARTAQVGQTITLTVLRDGRQVNVKVTLGERPSTAQ